jgi:hypothetical protein
MSFDPYDWEDEERRDSERFADASVYDEGPDPSEYEDVWLFEANLGGIENPDFEDGESWVAIEDLTDTWREIKDEYVKVFITQRHENDALKGLLVWLLIVLAGFMFWVWFGTTIARWVF